MRTLEEKARNLEEVCNEFGWDQLPMLFIYKGDQILDFAVMDGDKQDMYNFLSTFTPDADTSAVGFMTEGWIYGPDMLSFMEDVAVAMAQATGEDKAAVAARVAQATWEEFPPSQDQQRREVRNVLVMELDGSHTSVTRIRDEEPTITERDEGRIIDALTALMKRVQACNAQ